MFLLDPKQLLREPGVAVAFAAATHKRPGAAWGTTAIVILFSVDESREAGAATGYALAD